MVDRTPEQERDAVIDKVQAMLARTVDRGASENEAATALKMAHALLTKHNLSMAEVAMPDSHESQVVEEYEIVKVANGTQKRTAGWQGSLAHIIGKGFYVRVIQQGGRIAFIGRPTNVAITRELYNWCVPQCTTIAQDVAREQGYEPKYDRKQVASLRLGLLDRLHQRIQNMKNEAAQQDVKVTALVVSFETENEEYIQGKHGDLQTVEGPKIDPRAYVAGREAGDRVSLTPSSGQVEGGN